MKRTLAFALLLALSACNRHRVADVTLDAAAAQRNATAAKTLADLQAADQAARGPAPVLHDTPPAQAAPHPTPQAAPVENAVEMPADAIGDDVDTNG
jgi:hypothetical protein